MKKIKQRIKKNPLLVTVTVFFTLFFISNVCLIYSILKVENIENFIRYAVCGLLFLLFVILVLEVYKVIFKAKNLFIIIFAILLLALFIGESYAVGLISGFYNSINNIYKETYTYSTSMVVINDNKYKNIDDIKNIKIGMISDESSVDGYAIPKEIIKSEKLENKNEIVEYDGIGDVLKALYEEDIDAALVTSTYVSVMINTEGYQNIKEHTKVIYSKSKTVKKDSVNIDKNANDPISILIMGIDSTESDISKINSFNADSLMLLTFNPNTYNATILSIPRDTYTNIPCLASNPKTKITHSGWYGETCVVKTVSNLMDINIDYYAKINFKGVVSLVNAINGIEVDVPYSLCEQNSNREWGSKTVYIKNGLQTLNGEQALALSRNRHSANDGTDVGATMALYCPAYSGGVRNDFVRGQNQQLVINALINKIIQTSDVNKLYSIIDIIGSNVDTNVQINTMLSYYNVIKKIALSSDSKINFERLYLSTKEKYIYDDLLKLAISDQIYYVDSLNAIVNEMQVNLGLKEPTLIKKFSFSINNPYVLSIIGKGTFYQPDIETVPNFKSQDKSVAETWASNKNIKLNIIYEDATEGLDNIVLKQSIPSSYLVSKIKSDTELTITVSKLIKQTTE
jgi:LCP family protein required for cell wall assembly